MFYRILGLDLKRALLGKWRRYLVALFFFVFLTLACRISYDNAYLQNPELTHFAVPTLGDLLLYLFGGCDLYLFDLSKPFSIPFRWLLLVLLAIYVNFDLADESITGVNIQLLLRSAGRKKYWLSKVICVVVGASLYFLLGILTTIVCCLAFGGECTLEIDNLILNVMQLSSMVPRKSISPGFLPALAVEFLGVLSIVLVQQFLSLLVKPAGSFFCMAAFLVMSAYFMAPYLFGNYAMMIRSSLLCDGGLDAAKGFVILMIVCLLSVLGGCIVFVRKDILSKGES